MAEATKVGIIACSGEEIAAGTISRLATRRVLELLRPQSTVTLCLPLFLAGEEQETPVRPSASDDHRGRLRQAVCQTWHRAVQRPGRNVARRDRYSGQPCRRNVIARRVRLTRRMSRPSGRWPSVSRPKWMPWRNPRHSRLRSAAPPDASSGCACGGRPVEGNLRINGQAVTINALPTDLRSLAPTGRHGRQWFN